MVLFQNDGICTLRNYLTANPGQQFHTPQKLKIYKKIILAPTLCLCTAVCVLIECYKEKNLTETAISGNKPRRDNVTENE